jgi:dTDP-4-amino-4,6-dideoxygalactose transaminase
MMGTTAPYIQLERAFAEWVGYPASNVVVCSSGTAALHLAMEALGLSIHKGGEIILPNYTMVACPRAVTLTGLNPILVDCLQNNLLMDVSRIHHCINGHTVGIMAVHLYGRALDMESIHAIARPKWLPVIEDLAEAHGLKPHIHTDAACWSFYRNKVIAGEEGGAIAFKHPDAAHRARQLRTLGFTAEHDFHHIPRGHNYRLADLLAVPILRSLCEYDRNMRVRRELERLYEHYCPERFKQPRRVIPWVYDIRIPGMNREGQGRLVFDLFEEAGVNARQGFKPMTWQNEYRTCRTCGATQESERAATEVIYLPLDPTLFDMARLGMAEKAFEVIGRK